MNAKATLQRLLRIQDLALELRAARKTVEDAPGRVADIEQRFRERNAEFVAIQDQCEALVEDQKRRTIELAELEGQRDKFMSGMGDVKNQREYAAMLKEIDTVKAEIAAHEEAILKDMEGIERLTEELKIHEEHIATERAAVERERSEVEADAETARATIERLSDERLGIESELPSDTLKMVHRLESSRQGIFLSKADNGTCLACFVRVRPQVFQEVRQVAAIHTCGNCRRFLYYELAMRPEAKKTSSPSPTDSGSIEAVNGGAV